MLKAINLFLRKNRKIKFDLLIIILLGHSGTSKRINNILKNKVTKIAKRKGLTFSFKRAVFSTFSSFLFLEAEIGKGEILVKIDSLRAKINFLQVLKTRSFNKGIIIDIEGVSIAVKKGSIGSVSSSHLGNEKNKKKFNWEERYYSIFKKLSTCLFRLPYHITLHKATISFVNTSLNIDTFSCTENLINADIFATYKENTADHITLEGKIDRVARSFIFDRVRLVNMDEIKRKRTYDFSNLYLSYLETNDIQSVSSSLNIQLKVDNLVINNKKISREALLISDTELEIQINFDARSFILTEQSGGSFNNVLFAFEFAHSVEDDDVIKLVISIEVDAPIFLKSFPDFYNKGLRTLILEGKLLFQSSLIFSLNNPYKYFFELKVLENSITMANSGDFNLSYLETFSYPFENFGLISLNFKAHEATKLKLSEIGNRLMSIVIATEDPNFYQHNGVDPYFVGVAIISNIANRRFSKGGSTITMQVARNLFLEHDKNLFRKLEEVIITLLLENTFKISKLRLLEIYLNIIEFAPGVYGISDASNFYFAKRPADLTILECVVLTYIIPRPRHFYDALLIKTPQLLHNLPEYVNGLLKNLLHKKIITNDDLNSIGDHVVFANQLGFVALR